MEFDEECLGPVIAVVVCTKGAEYTLTRGRHSIYLREFSLIMVSIE